MDIGFDANISRCTRFNPFDPDNEKTLIAKTRIINIWQDTSRGRDLDDEKSRVRKEKEIKSKEIKKSVCALSVYATL